MLRLTLMLSLPRSRLRLPFLSKELRIGSLPLVEAALCKRTVEGEGGNCHVEQMADRVLHLIAADHDTGRSLKRAT